MGEDVTGAVHVVALDAWGGRGREGGRREGGRVKRVAMWKQSLSMCFFTLDVGIIHQNAP